MTTLRQIIENLGKVELLESLNEKCKNGNGEERAIVSALCVFHGIGENGELVGSIWDVCEGEEIAWTSIYGNCSESGGLKDVLNRDAEDILKESLETGTCYFDGVFSDFRDVEIKDRKVFENGQSIVSFFTVMDENGKERRGVEFGTSGYHGVSAHFADFQIEIDKDTFDELYSMALNGELEPDYDKFVDTAISARFPGYKSAL